MNLDALEHLLLLCEQSDASTAAAVIYDAAVLRFGKSSVEQVEIERLIEASADLDAATRLLPEPAIWRKYTDDTATVYGASPYNAAAQVPYQGFNSYTPLAITQGAVRMWVAAAKKAAAA